MDVFKENLIKFTREVYKKFTEIRNKPKAEIPFRFWDVVVLTSADAKQKEAFELQIAGKLRRQEIPSDIEYLVFADPPGVKVGCGGATMYVIKELTVKYGGKLDDMYVLLINAGGQSQRLASASMLGKVFTALPMGTPPWQVLELKLACYIPFLERMKPGFLHVASDTIEIFYVENDENYDNWNFTLPGLTAIAHPSTIDIAKSHGVFVLAENSLGTTDDASVAKFVQCIEVLQKPSAELMKQKKAIIKLDDDQEIVYTDSLYYFDHAFARKLLEFFDAEAPLQCEIDGYGDFMQPLGANATSDYVSDLQNYSFITSSTIPTRLRLFHFLKGTQLNVIALNQSRFYHLGSKREYLNSLCSGSGLASCINFRQLTFSLLSESCTNNGFVVHSIIADSSSIGPCSVVEYCRIQRPVVIGASSILSNCSLGPLGDTVQVPGNFLYHTIPVRKSPSDILNYVTLVFHIDDNVKVKVDKKDEENAKTALLYCSKPLIQTVGPSVSDNDLFSPDASGKLVQSLWYTRLFAIESTMEEAFMSGLRLARGGSVLFDLWKNTRFMSAAETSEGKDIHEMLGYRSELFSAIVAGH